MLDAGHLLPARALRDHMRIDVLGKRSANLIDEWDSRPLPGDLLELGASVVEMKAAVQKEDSLAEALVVVPDNPLSGFVFWIGPKSVIVRQFRLKGLHEGPIEQEVVVDRVDVAVELGEETTGAAVLPVLDLPGKIGMFAG